VPRPSVALLSIGEEAGKGEQRVQEATELLSSSGLNFIGNIEGNDVYSGRVDVVVTDGFTGNVTLKVTESMIESLRSALRQEMARSLRTRLGALLMKPAFEGLEKRVDYAEYGGAPLLGARECVIICHGRSSPKAIKNAIGVAREFVERRVNERTAQEIRSLAEAETRLVG